MGGAVLRSQRLAFEDLAGMPADIGKAAGIAPRTRTQLPSMQLVNDPAGWRSSVEG